ncbi:MAG: hypothetical protein R3Y24_11965, partial [Eubacteriales bacterium]
AGDVESNSNLNQLQIRTAIRLAERMCNLWAILENGYIRSVFGGIFFQKNRKMNIFQGGMTKYIQQRRGEFEYKNYCTI